MAPSESSEFALSIQLNMRRRTFAGHGSVLQVLAQPANEVLEAAFDIGYSEEKPSALRPGIADASRRMGARAAACNTQVKDRIEAVFADGGLVDIIAESRLRLRA